MPVAHSVHTSLNGSQYVFLPCPKDSCLIEGVPNSKSNFGKAVTTDPAKVTPVTTTGLGEHDKYSLAGWEIMKQAWKRKQSQENGMRSLPFESRKFGQMGYLSSILFNSVNGPYVQLCDQCGEDELKLMYIPSIAPFLPHHCKSKTV